MKIPKRKYESHFTIRIACFFLDTHENYYALTFLIILLAVNSSTSAQKLNGSIG